MKYIIFSLLLCGCETQKSAAPSQKDNDKSHRLAIESLREEIKSHESLVFGSRMGNMQGQDSDATIELKNNGDVVVMEYKISVLDYYGRFKINDNGKIVVSLRDYPGEWPVMIASLDGKSILLHREDGITAPSREAQEYEEFSNYWPFGQAQE